MTLSGGKRKVNKSLKSWVAFVKKVQKEEKLSYKDAIHRAKVRKDKGEKWMMGGGVTEGTPSANTSTPMDIYDEDPTLAAPVVANDAPSSVADNENQDQEGGRRRRRTMRRSRGRGRARTARRGRSRASRRR